MKIFYVLLAIVATLMLTSCGSTRKATTSQTDIAVPQANLSGETILVEEPCDVYAMIAPAKRATGEGIHFQAATARNIAELNARAQLARALQVCIETTTKTFADGATKFAADDTTGTLGTDQTASLADRTAGMAKELIKGAPVVKMSRYKTANNQYRVYVCVEYSEEVSQMAAKIAETFKDQLTPDEKLKIKFNEDLFKKEMEETFKDYKGITSEM